MNSSQLLGFTTFAYLLASALYLAIFIFRAQKLGVAASVVTGVAWLVQTAGIALRWVESYQMGYGHAPLSNMYESLVFFAWAIAIIYLWLEWKFKNRLIGAFAIPFAFFSMAYASFSSSFGSEIKPLLPALQSNWLIGHVVTCFIGYASFAVACGLGIMYLLKDRRERPKKKHQQNSDGLIDTLPKLRLIDDAIYKTIIFGFVWLTTGIIAGAIWAN